MGSLFSSHNEHEHSPWQVLFDLPNVYCLNDGRITRPQSGRALDATFVRNCNVVQWDVLPRNRTYESDHLEISVILRNVLFTRHKQDSLPKAGSETVRDWSAIKANLRYTRLALRPTMSGRQVLEWYSTEIGSMLKSEDYHRPAKHKEYPWWNKHLHNLKRQRNRSKPGLEEN